MTQGMWKQIRYLVWFSIESILALLAHSSFCHLLQSMSGLSAAEELRMMELELAILQKKRELASSGGGSVLSGRPTPDVGTSSSTAAKEAPVPPPPPPYQHVAEVPAPMPGQASEKRARKSQKGRGSDPKLASTTDDTAGEDWAAVMQAEVCNTSKIHPTKGTLGKKYAAKEERPAKEEHPSTTGEEKVPLRCSGRKVIVGQCSQFLLHHEGKEEDCETWAGGRWGSCFSCSRFNTGGWQDEQEEAAARKQFTNAAKKSWMATTKHYKDIAVRARCGTWAGFKARLKKRFPQAKDDEMRNLIQQRVKVAVETFMANFEKESEEAMKARIEAHERYIKSLEDMANNPAYSPAQKAHGLKFSAEEAAWLTRISEGCTVSFSCRNPECRFYGMNDQWVLGERYRCPRCMEEYWPWKGVKKNARGNVVFEYLPFQKVVVIEAIDGNTWIWPAQWPGSRADSWLLEQAEIYAANLQVEGDLRRYMEDTMTSLMQLCERVGATATFQHYDWDADAEHRLDVSKYPRDGEQGWGRLAENGYWGNILPLPKDGKWEVFTEWTDLIQLIGQAMYCRRELSITKV